MRNNAGKKKQNRIVGFSRKVLVPSFAGAAYAMSRMTVTVLAAGGDVLSPLAPHPKPDDGGMGCIVRDSFGVTWIITCPNPDKTE